VLDRIIQATVKKRTPFTQANSPVSFAIQDDRFVFRESEASNGFLKAGQRNIMRMTVYFCLI